MTPDPRPPAHRGQSAAWDDGYRRGVIAERARHAALVEAARDHGICTCEPRPIGGGREYHYIGCDNDPVLRAALLDGWQERGNPATPAPLDEGGRGACHPCSRHDHLRCVLDRPCPCRDTVHDCGVVDCEPTGRRLFDLKDDADHDWLADYFAGYHGVPMLDVERLARALESAISGTQVTPLALRSEFGLPPIWEPLAAAIAAAYAEETK